MDKKQLLDEVFLIFDIIKVEVSVRLRLITLTETLIILDITKTESNNCFITHSFTENDKSTACKRSHLFFVLPHRKISKLLPTFSCLLVPDFFFPSVLVKEFHCYYSGPIAFSACLYLSESFDFFLS